MTVVDPHSGRVVAPAAQESLRSFRAAGGRSFDQLGVDEARRKYESSCAANGLPPDPVRSVRNAVVGEQVPVRIYDPRPDGTDSPAILFVHGGGWVMGSLGTHDGLCRRLATRTGFPVVAVDYRLAPEHRYPAAIDDCRSVLQWMTDPSRNNALGVSSVAVVGDSAGGQIAASLTLEAADRLDAVPITAQALLYPVTDLVSESPSYTRITSGFPLVAETMRWFARLYVPDGVDRGRRDLSPLRGPIPSNVPPTFVCTVDNDPLAEEGLAYAHALASAGTDVQSVHLAGFAHGVFTSAGALERGEQVLDEVANFVVAQSKREVTRS